MGQEIFPVMWGGARMGQEKSMRGGGEDPILRPRPAPLPSLGPSSHGRSHQAASGKLHLRSALPRVARKCRPSEEGKWEMANVCGLHRPEQGMPEGQFPPTKDRPACGFNSWTQIADVHRRFLRI